MHTPLTAEEYRKLIDLLYKCEALIGDPVLANNTNALDLYDTAWDQIVFETEPYLNEWKQIMNP